MVEADSGQEMGSGLVDPSSKGDQMDDKTVTVEMSLSEAKALSFFVPAAEETYTEQGLNLANAHAKLEKAIRHIEVRKRSRSRGAD